MSNSDTIRITVSGDFYPVLRIKPAQNILGELEPVLADSELNITNLECPLTNSDDKIKKSGPHLKAEPSAVKLLQQAKLKLVTLANNHLMDFGSEGYNDTIAALQEKGIAYVGAGSNLSEARKPRIIECKEKKIAILNFAQKEFSIAGKYKPGANPIDIIENYNQIIAAKAESDYQIVIAHAGIEHYKYPTPNLQKLYRFYAGLGVSAVVSHHSHCISGYEVYCGVPIFYGLGNFIFDEPEHKASWYEGMLLELIFESDDELKYHSHHFKQDINDDVYCLKLLDSELPEVINEEIVLKNWHEYIRGFNRRRNTLNNLHNNGFITRLLNKFIPDRMNSGFDCSYLNLLRNDINYEYIISILEDINGEK